MPHTRWAEHPDNHDVAMRELRAAGTPGALVDSTREAVRYLDPADRDAPMAAYTVRKAR